MKTRYQPNYNFNCAENPPSVTVCVSSSSQDSTHRKKPQVVNRQLTATASPQTTASKHDNQGHVIFLVNTFSNELQH